jgi:hypothetical protein
VDALGVEQVACRAHDPLPGSGQPVQVAGHA